MRPTTLIVGGGLGKLAASHTLSSILPQSKRINAFVGSLRFP